VPQDVSRAEEALTATDVTRWYVVLAPGAHDVVLDRAAVLVVVVGAGNRTTGRSIEALVHLVGLLLATLSVDGALNANPQRRGLVAC
jgi:hypothetical protein